MLSREYQSILDFLLELTREEQQCSSQTFDDVEISSEELERINDFFNKLSKVSDWKLEDYDESKRDLFRYW